ncbi:Gryzun, putative trafficking through golgi-domain-containing protein [Lipomyces arxii]|uniref:Gryzun, putative trafficking through golgi-domain-containing protein n=1 Tax=Lipomyces arxii TaxID=56418 RepID=UPI0034CE19D1
MDLYPPEYICHNLPLMLVSGLTSTPSSPAPGLTFSDSTSPRVSPTPDTSLPNGPQLLKAFTEGAEGHVWESSALKSERKAAAPVYRVLAVPKNFQLPTKKASPLSPASVSSFSSTTKQTVQHSTLSPLSTESPLYPDGIMNQFWLRKYRNLLPSVFVSVHEIFTNTEDTQVKLSHDNDLIKEINEHRKQMAARNVKLAIVIVSSRTILQNIDISDRVTYLRRTTGMDARTGLFFLPPGSDIQTFVKELKGALYPTALDFYGALLKHARRKRGHTPSPSSSALPTSSQLDLAGWNIRYEFKQAVFAEYKQEIDVAIKLYGIVYEALLEFFDSIPVDSFRWNEARMLLDIIAFKILKCNLYQNQPIMAQKVFNVHMESVTALVQKRFSTHDTYCYYAWRARQYHMLGQLLDMVPEDISPRNSSFASVGTGIVGSDFPSANVLHHSGFQYLYAAAATVERKNRAFDTDTGASDYYLVSPPEQEQKFDHTALLLHLLESAYSRFKRDDETQTRTQAYIAYEIFQTYFKSNSFVDALKYFHLSVPQYRKEGWYSILGSMLADAITAAKQTENKEELIKLQFESISRDIPWNPEIPKISKFLDSVSGAEEEKLELQFESGSITPFVEAHFAFMVHEAHLASSVDAQLSLRFLQAPQLGPIDLSSIQINFTRGLKSVVITNDLETTGATPRVQHLKLTDDGNLNISKARLVFETDRVCTLQFSLALKTLGFTEASSVILTFVGNSFVAKVALDLADETVSSEAIAIWMKEVKGRHVSQRFTAPKPRSINVIPKQPHIDIVPGFKGPAYVDEQVVIPLTITNREQENIDVTLSVTVQTIEEQPHPSVAWVGKEPKELLKLGLMPGLEVETAEFSIDMPSEVSGLIVEIVATYYLESEPGVEIVKTQSLDLPVILPFQVSYDFAPRIYPKRWPSPFFIYDLESHSPPITRRWCLSATIDAVDLKNLKIHDYEFDITNATGIECNILHEGPKMFVQDGNDLSDVYEHDFVMDVTNSDVTEKRIATADAQLVLSWSRTNGNGSTETQQNLFKLPNLKLTIPLLEPRVLMDVGSTSPENVHLVYFIENATSHILTFSVTLDLNNDMSLSYPVRHQLRQQSYSKETILDATAEGAAKNPAQQEKGPFQHTNFGYEGAKQIGVRVLPYSTRKLEYSLLPLAVTSGWQRVPSLRVYDTHFKKSLSVFPATDKLRIDFRTGAVYVNISKTQPDEK